MMMIHFNKVKHDMDTMIKHFLQNNEEEVVSKSLFNCHCIGLHSVMLLDSPGKTIRLYLADNNHQMNENVCTKDMNIGYHPHHCDLTLKVIKGWIININAKISKNKPENEPLLINKYIYKSKITKGELQFYFEEINYLIEEDLQTLNRNEEIFLPAKSIHTVIVPRGKRAAWLVFEGKEDIDYKPFLYTNNPMINNVPEKNLYIKPTKEQIVDLLKKFNLI